jgi:hypothetical protein
MTDGNQEREQIAGVPGEDFSKQAHLREAGEQKAEAPIEKDEDSQMIGNVEEIGLVMVPILVIATGYRQEREALVLSARG